MRILLILLLSSGISFAQDTGATNPFDENTDESIEQRPQAKPDEFRVTMTKKDCKRVVKHAPADDVAYQPGVDSRGNAVAPADIPGSQMQFDLPDDIEFDLALNPFDYGGNADLADIFSNSSTNLGTVKYSITSGKMTLNGNSLTDDQLDVIAKSCRAQGIVK